MDMSNEDKASDKRPLGGGATPRGDRQPLQDDLAMDKDRREMESNIEVSDDSLEQTQTLDKEEQAKMEREAFRRKPIIARTPPPGRATSYQKEVEDDRNLIREKEDLQGEKAKRKRGEDSPTTSVMTQKEPKKLREVGTEEDKKTKLIESVKELIRRVDASVANLYSTTSTSRNTKVEIKEEAEKLVVLMKKLVNKDIGNLLEDGENIKPKTREVGVQADLGGKPNVEKNEEMAEVTSLEGIDTLERWRDIANRRWHPEVFTCTRVVHGGDIMDTRDEVVKVAFTPKSDDKATSKRVWERFPELLETEEEFAVLEQTTKIRASSEADVTRKIIKVTRVDSEEDLWANLCRVREETKEDGLVAFEQPIGKSLIYFRKMLECIYQGTKAKAIIHVSGNVQSGKKRQRRKPKVKNERDTYALVVEGTRSEPYTSVLRQVKDKVRESTVSGKIRGLRSTRDGRLLITMDRDESATNRVEEILSEMRDNLKISKAGQKSQEATIHIRGMDALTTKQDVIEAVERRVGPLTGKTCRLSELRPNLGNTLAATLVLNKEEAGRIVEGGILRVGCVNCNVERRITLTRCYRCWSYTHKASECSSEIDRSKCCYQCGGEGHTAKTCNKEEACPVCGEPGHMADTRNCRIFRTALQKAREEARRKDGEGREKRVSAIGEEEQETQKGGNAEKEDEDGEPAGLAGSEGRSEMKRPEEGPGLESLSSASQTS